ncbi:MAG: hypothetical protein H6755_03045 [Candidatus Omnitrophica bacterium]|nr:hypothetical protein [Candidatus Omnitrophota bacterium]MCB9747363.1 hypothetical protein [Candidatus Omnitrophota bacterium]
MNILIIIAIVLFIIGIIVMVGGAPSKGRTEDDFVNSIQKFVKGSKETIGEGKESYQINFIFEGMPFVYEKIEIKGFKEGVFNVHLKAKTNSNFNLLFSEKGQGKTVDPNRSILGVNVPEGDGGQGRVTVPKELGNFNIDTNNVGLANRLLQDKKIIQVFMKYINVDSRGYHLLTMNIKDGDVFIEFDTHGIRKPSYHALKGNVSLLEYYIDDLMVVAKKVKMLV